MIGNDEELFVANEKAWGKLIFWTAISTFYAGILVGVNCNSKFHENKEIVKKDSVYNKVHTDNQNLYKFK